MLSSDGGRLFLSDVHKQAACILDKNEFSFQIMQFSVNKANNHKQTLPV